MAIYRRQAELILKNRKRKRLSQGEISKRLGFTRGQFISNVERGLCGYGSEQIILLAQILKLKPKTLIDAKVEDYRESVEKQVYFS